MQKIVGPASAPTQTVRYNNFPQSAISRIGYFLVFSSSERSAALCDETVPCEWDGSFSTKLAPRTSSPSIRTSCPSPGDGNGSCVAFALRSNQVEMSSDDVDVTFCDGCSKASRLQLRISFGQSFCRVSFLSKKSEPTITPATTNTAALQSVGAGSFSSSSFNFAS